MGGLSPQAVSAEDNAGAEGREGPAGRVVSRGASGSTGRRGLPEGRRPGAVGPRTVRERCLRPGVGRERPGGGARLRGLGPGPLRRSRGSPSRTSLCSRMGPTRETRGRSGQSGAGKTCWEGEGAEASGR